MDYNMIFEKFTEEAKKFKLWSHRNWTIYNRSIFSDYIQNQMVHVQLHNYTFPIQRQKPCDTCIILQR